MLLIIKDTKPDAARWAADYIARKIIAKPNIVLGLPTGSSPVPIYENLISMHRRGELSFRDVITFNMDEYVGVPENHPRSFHYYMERHFFKHIDIRRENINFLDGNANGLRRECDQYEEKIKCAGGIDLFLAGLGVDGHLAFNEPGSSLTSRTRDKDLTYDTMQANARFFDDDITKVPKKSLTVGVGTIMDADEILVIVTGYSKAHALHKIVEEGVNHMWTASMLQLHSQCIIVCDEEATMELKVGTVKYFKDVEIDSNDVPKFCVRQGTTDL